MPSARANRLKVRDAWKDGKMHHASNFETVGGIVYSYHHTIGITHPDGKRIAFDCHYSPQTSMHCHTIFPAADQIQPCPMHPKPNKVHGPVPEDSSALVIAKPLPHGKINANSLYAGIEDAIQTLLDTNCMYDMCEGPDRPQDMITCSKCWVIVGLRNVLAGKEFHEKPAARSTPT